LFDSVKLSVYLSKELEANIEFKGAFKSWTIEAKNTVKN
jgi:hypothetical protein